MEDHPTTSILWGICSKPVILNRIIPGFIPPGKMGTGYPEHLLKDVPWHRVYRLQAYTAMKVDSHHVPPI
jgi:hypothetical protein